MSREPERVSYNAFRDDDEERPQANGLKVKNKRSFVSNSEAAREADARFDKEMKEAAESSKILSSKIAKAADNYLSIISRKVITENKSQAQIEEEREVINNLVELVMQANMDPTQPIGTGSVGVISLMLKLLLLQRDKINDLSYNCFKMKELLVALSGDDGK